MALVVRVEDASVVADGGPGWFVVSGLDAVARVAERAASAGGSVSIDQAGRLRALVTPTQLVNAAGRVDGDLGRALEAVVAPAVEGWLSPPPDLTLGDGSTLACATRPQVMGVVNVTPDSFSDGGVAYDPAEHPDRAVAHGLRLHEAGADLLDVGGESTRPGATPVDADEECRRVVPVVTALAAAGARVSVDTTKSQVARAAVEAGAVMVNDVSAGTLDHEMLATVAGLGTAYVAMHMRGTPRTMQDAPAYDDVVAEVYEYLAGVIERTTEAGVAPERLVVDPGIGFGKTVEHNLALLRATRQFVSLARPVLVGASRKSFLGEITGVGDPRERDPASLAAATVAVAHGAAIVRVHEVAATRDAVAVAAALR